MVGAASTRDYAMIAISAATFFFAAGSRSHEQLVRFQITEAPTPLTFHPWVAPSVYPTPCSGNIRRAFSQRRLDRRLRPGWVLWWQPG